MDNNIPSYRPTPRTDSSEKSDKSFRTRETPSHDKFKRSLDHKEPRKQEVNESEEPEETPSLFDLSKSSKGKEKPSLPSSKTKDSSKSSSLSSTSKSKGKEEGELKPLLADAGDATDFDSETGDALESPPADEGTPQIKTTEKKPLFSDTAPQTKNWGEKKSDSTSQPSLLDGALAQGVQKEMVQKGASLQGQRNVKAERKDSSTEGVDKSVPPSKKQKTEEKTSSSDLSNVKGEGVSVFSGTQAAAFSTEKAENAQEMLPSKTLAEIADKIVAKIDVMQKTDETKTTITLSNPPSLANATITITASSHAKGEFNISFAGLSPEGKALLDRSMQESPLTDHLRDKGITVHIVTTSTQPENLLSTDASQSSRDRQDQQQQQQQDQEQQQKRKGRDYSSDEEEE